MNVTAAEEVQLMCSIMAFPPPHIDWYHNGSMVHPNERVIISEHDTESRTIESFINILHATNTDSGLYTCGGSNAAGSVLTTPAWLLIQGKVIFSRHLKATLAIATHSLIAAGYA